MTNQENLKQNKKLLSESSFLLRIFLSLILLTFNLSSHSQKRYFGTYLNPGKYWSPKFVFQKDSSFTYECHCKTNEDVQFFDSTYGKYTLRGDTVILTYLFNNYHPYLSDSPKDSAKWEIIEPRGYYGNRPQKLYWKKKTVYYISKKIGHVIYNKEYRFEFIKQ